MKKSLLSLLTLFSFFYSFSQAPTNGLVAYWPLDSNYNDSGPNAIHGTNFASTSATNVFGETNKAMAFSNTDPSYLVVSQYASHPNSTNLNFALNQDFSLDFNVSIASPYIHPGGLYDYGLNYNGFGIYYWAQNGFLQAQFNFGNASVGSSNGGLTYDTWQHITAIKEGSFIKIYINGVLNATGNSGVATPNYSGIPGRFGTSYWASFSPPHYNGFNGKMDEFRIYNRALTQSEITTLYELNLLETESFTSNELRFAPNPAKDRIIFNHIIKSLEVYDITGKLVHTGLNQTELEIADWMNGIYIIKAITNEEIPVTAKFVKI